MKGRSSRGASTEAAADEWMNGSWTVDCICGVTFDDGEEMVNCDECGVWVHTRCSRFVKGETSFACDKCKAKNHHHNHNNNSISRTDSEETEVAQLLVELPTKTMKMSAACASAAANHKDNTSIKNIGAAPRPYRLWTERPLEERVHVQGVPGGDPSLFEGFPLLFASQLWKCTGYIPKKFNFRYSEFPCWENLIDADGAGDDTVASGGGVAALHSLSKPTVTPAPPSPSPSANNHNTTLRPFAKRMREVSGPSKDRSSRKKLKSLNRDHDSKRDCKPPALKTGTVNSTNAGPVQALEAKAPNRACSPRHAEPKTKVASELDSLLPRSPEESTHASSTERTIKLHMPALDATRQIQTSPNRDSVRLSSLEKDVIVANPIKKEGLVLAVDKIEEVRSGTPTSISNLSKSQPILEHVANCAPDLKKEFLRNSESVIPLASGKVNGETIDVKLDDSKGVLARHPAEADTESDGIKDLTECVLSPDKEGESLANRSQCLEQDGRDTDKGFEAGNGYHVDINDKLVDVPCNAELEYEDSERSTEVLTMSSDSKAVASDVVSAIPPPPTSHHKTVFVGKSSVSSPAIVFSRSSLSDKSKSCSSQNSSLVAKHFTSNSSVNSRKENLAVNSVKSEEKHERPKSTLNDHPKSCLSSNVKASQPSRTSSGPVLKHYTSAGKDSLRQSSLKVSSMERVESSPLSLHVNDPAAGVLQDEHASVHGRDIASGGQQQGEEVTEWNLQPSSKLIQSSVGQPSASINPSAGLSDEEYALLLHQQLNSSPRVPRVPRIRHAGCLPQLSAVAVTNMLNKRTSGPGGKEQHTFSRRRSKDALRDAARSTLEQDTKARKADKVPSSPDSFKTSDVKTEGRSELLHTKRKKNEKIASSAANSGSLSSDADEPRSSSLRSKAPEEEIGSDKSPATTYRTLPGLIAEIMGKGRRMTYEELCNAVLPHWQNLRKHNGERYAYSSHSQAVLDCLRNRTEWARLVDRGPKTSGSRKKRKTDAEPSNTESEDGDDSMPKAGESKSFESNKEEFPKGRRKARKRRKLTLHGRGGKDGQKRRVVESDNSGSFSDSIEDSLSSEDDSQVSGMGTAKSEASTSSQEARG